MKQRYKASALLREVGWCTIRDTEHLRIVAKVREQYEQTVLDALNSLENDKPTPEKVIFLDFDGVIRVPVAQGRVDFDKECMGWVELLCASESAKIVVSSDWRREDDKESIVGMLGPLSKYLHDDWMTPICGYRWHEVLRWSEEHPSAKYVILDDVESHFTDAPSDMLSRLVICDSNLGIRFKEFKEVKELLKS